MRLSQWQPSGSLWSQLQQLQHEMNGLLERWGREPSASTFPAMNLWEEPEAFVVETELPGLDLKDLEIYVTGGDQLSIKGQRKPSVPEKGVVHRQERGHGSFTRVLRLPSPVDPDKVDARFENGVLLLRLHKHEAARPRKIQVKG